MPWLRAVTSSYPGDQVPHHRQSADFVQEFPFTTQEPDGSKNSSGQIRPKNGLVRSPSVLLDSEGRS